MTQFPATLEATTAQPAVLGRWAVVSSAARYYGLMGLAGLVSLVKGIVYAKVLGSEALGLYALVVLIANYAEEACHLGLYRGLECFLPQLYGSGRAREAHELRNRVGGVVALQVGVLLVVALVATWFLPPGRAALRLVLLLSVPLIAASMLLALVIQDLRSRARTMTFASVLLARALLMLGAGVLVAQAFGYAGVVVVEIAAIFGLFAVTRRVTCEDFRFQLAGWRRLRPVFAVGIPFALKNLTNQFALTMDRWCVLSALGLAAFSQYAFAMILVAIGLTVHASIWVHFGPRGARQFGRDGDIRKFCRSLHRIALVILALFVVGAVPFAHLVDFVVPRYFAEYQEGGRLLSIVYWGVGAQIVTVYEWVPMVLKKTGALFAVTIVCTALTAGLYGLGIALAWPLVGFAWVFVFGRLLMAAGYLGTAEVLTARRASMLRGGEVA